MDFLLHNVHRFNVDNFAGARSNVAIALDLFISDLCRSRKYYVRVLLKDDEMYIVAQDLKLKERVFDGLMRKNPTLGEH